MQRPQIVFIFDCTKIQKLSVPTYSKYLSSKSGVDIPINLFARKNVQHSSRFVQTTAEVSRTFKHNLPLLKYIYNFQILSKGISTNIVLIKYAIF